MLRKGVVPACLPCQLRFGSGTVLVVAPGRAPIYISVSIERVIFVGKAEYQVARSAAFFERSERTQSARTLRPYAEVRLTTRIRGSWTKGRKKSGGASDYSHRQAWHGGGGVHDAVVVAAHVQQLSQLERQWKVVRKRHVVSHPRTFSRERGGVWSLRGGGLSESLIREWTSLYDGETRR